MVDKQKRFKAEKKSLEVLMRNLFIFCSVITIGSLLLIIGFLVLQGLPALLEYGIVNFITGTVWNPEQGQYGIWNMLLATLITTIGTMIICVPLGVLAAVYISKYAHEKFAHVLKLTTRLLASIPSVIFGFFGLIVIIPIMREVFGGSGQSILSAILVLSIMVLPTIISISVVALDSVSHTFEEASLALGASKAQTLVHVVVPVAKSGIFSGIILGVGRALGETIAVMMVIGNSSSVESISLLGPARTLTTNIGTEMNYASGTHQEMLFATGIILLFFIMLCNYTMMKIKKRGTM